MKLDNVEIELDVFEYLQEKGLRGLKMVGENAMACCPFHGDHQASFGVHTLTGAWQCFGCGSKGSFPLLVKELDQFDTVHDAFEYLIDMYGRFTSARLDKPLVLDFGEKKTRNDYKIEDSILKEYRFRHPYLSKRNLGEDVQRFFEIGYSAERQAITFPYRNEKGDLLTIKFRKTTSKQFWYEPAMPSNIKKETLYGLYQAIKKNRSILAITEAEIDCLSVWQAGISAVAIGGNQFSDEQAKKLMKWISDDTEILMFVDNDAGGEIAKNLIVEKLSGRFPISEVNWSLIGRSVKDANDLSVEEVKMLVEQRLSKGLKLF